MIDETQKIDSPPAHVPRRPDALVYVCGSITLVAVFAAAFLAGQNQSLRKTTSQNPFGLEMPTLDATAAVSSEKFSMATGFLSQDAEGLFMLDHNSGLLQCSVMYPRAGTFAGNFTINVHDALGATKNARYMMVTGLVDLPSNNANPLAKSVVYVLNTASGQFACYAVPYNRTMMNANRPQSAPMRLVAVGSADPIIDRDNLR